MSFASCIRDAQARGEITKEDADAIMERYTDLRQRMPPLRARDELSKMLAIAGAEKRRRDLLGAKAKDELIRDVMSYRTPHGAHDMAEAMYNLWEGFGHAGYPGVKQIHEAYIGLAHSMMADVLEAYKRTAITGSRRQTVPMSELRKASFGEKADPKAVALYQGFAKAAEFMRGRYNELGGAIPQRSDWGMPQSHNEAAVARAFGGKTPDEARANWVKYINQRLNWSKMFDPLTGELFGSTGEKGVPPVEISDDRKVAILGHVWDTIVSGGTINIRPSLVMKGRGSIATQRTDHRFLVFKDAQSASDYNKEFGSGDEFTQMMDHLHSMASDIAILQRFGPNPSGMLEYMKQMLRLEGGRATAGATHRLRGVRPEHAQDDARNKVQAAEHTLDAFFEQYRGDAPARNKLALVGEIAGNIATGSLLGSSAIPHAASNWIIQSAARHAGGIPMARVIPEILQAFSGSSHEEMLRAGLDIDNGLYHINTGAKQLGRWQKIANWTKWLPDRTTHLFGLIPIVEANKGAFFRGTMATLADLQRTNWNELPERIRSKMQGYGIRERDWRVMQMAGPYTPSVGSAPWLRPNEVMSAHEQPDGPERVLSAYGRTMAPTAGTRFGDNGGPSLDATRDAEEAARITRDIGLKLLTYMHGEREIAVPTNSMRARAVIYGSTDRGSWPGLIRRSAGMFKGFIGSFMVSQIHTIWNEMARNRWKGAAYIASLATGMILGGMVSLQLKQMSAGKDPAPMNAGTRTGFVTWLRAVMTSGSFGIFGDFLASDRSSFGIGPLETLAGPVVGWGLAGAEGTKDTATELFDQFTGGKRRREPLGTTLANAGVKFARANTPGLSTGWPLRAAWNRILDQIQMSYDRDAVHKQRMQEERMRKETNQSFWWRPGQMTPDRLPQLTPSR